MAGPVCLFIVDRFHDVLLDQFSEHLDRHRAGLVSAVEMLWDKYRVTIGYVVEERDAAKAKLDEFLTELGYAR